MGAWVLRWRRRLTRRRVSEERRWSGRPTPLHADVSRPAEGDSLGLAAQHEVFPPTRM